jgi:adenylate cyclase
MFEFAGHTLDTERGRLQKGGQEVALRPKSLSLLNYMLANAGRVISKDELVSTIWPDIAVSDDSLTQCMKDIRKALGPDSEGLIRTVMRRGYIIDESKLRSSNKLPVEFTETINDKASIAVIPFDNLSDDPGQDYFATGVVEEITAALSRLRWLFVAAHGSSATYKEQSFDFARIARELGVRYILKGSVRKAGDRIRIGGQLIDGGTGVQLWADRYDGLLSDIFDLQDRVTESVVGAIQPSILSAEVERSRRKRPESLDAYDFMLRAFPLVWSLDRQDNESATAFLDSALAIEPTYALALSLKAWCLEQQAVYNWTDTPAELREEGLRLAKRAVSLHGDDPLVLAVLGAAHSFARDFDIAEAHLERARTLDPNSAWAWMRSGWLNVYRERTDAAFEQFARFNRLSPIDPMNYISHIGIGAAHFVNGDYEHATASTRKGLSQHPEAHWALRQLVSALALEGRIEEARHECGNLLKAYPGLTIGKVADALPFAPNTMTRIIEGLRAAGLTDR